MVSQWVNERIEEYLFQVYDKWNTLPGTDPTGSIRNGP